MSDLRPWTKTDHPLLPWSFIHTGDDVPAVMPTEAAERAIRGVNALEFPNEMIAAAEAETARLRAQAEAVTALMQEHLRVQALRAEKMAVVAEERDAAREELRQVIERVKRACEDLSEPGAGYVIRQAIKGD